MNPRSLANLKPFQKGTSGNPGGKPKLPAGLREVRELTPEELRRLIAKYARMSRADLEVVLADGSPAPMLDMAIAASLQSASSGSFAHLSFLLDRAIGKPKAAADDDGDDEDTSTMTTEDAKRILAEDFATQPDEKVEVTEL